MEWNFSLKNINRVAKDFRKIIDSKNVVAFHGPMGSGKTTFIHALCDEIGVKDVVGSPTFSIINEYGYKNDGIKKILFHIDLYRLKDEEEALKAGVEECLYSGNICLVEWPEKAIRLFPPDTIHAYLEIVDGKTRRLKIGNI
jgi:tRNA threonylcarbamoyladenosine biosynthesis protein TsaE